MKHILFGAVAMGLIYFTSCKEVPVTIDKNAYTDTTYVAAVETPQAKNLLIEEFTGVRCPNCPAGAELLHNYNASGEFANKLCVISIHSGSLTEPILNHEPNSIQDFRTDDGMDIHNMFGGASNKPCIVVDRLKLGDNSTYFGSSTIWYSMLQGAMTEAGNATPVNIDISSTKKTENEYEIEVKVAYTQEISERLALTVYLNENNIEDAQEFPVEYGMYTFQHVFRKSITPFNGKEILPDMSSKEAGRVFIQRFTLTIDPNDAKQKFWKPENMELVAFVGKTGGDKLQVLHAQVDKLIP